MVRNVVRLPTGLMCRNGVFYFRQDIKSADGKYKSIRHSLRTKNLEQAIQGLDFMKKFMKQYNELTPEEQQDFVKWYTRGAANTKLQLDEEQELLIGDCNSIAGIAYDAWVAERVDPEELIKTIIENRPKIKLYDKGFEDSAYQRYIESKKAAKEIVYARYFLSKYAEKHPEILDEFDEIIDFADESRKYELWEQYVAMREGKPVSIVVSESTQSPIAMHQMPPKHTIQEVFDLMLARQSFAASTIKKRKSDFSIIMQYTGLFMGDDCSKLIDQAVISKVIDGVRNRKDTKGDRKNDILGTLKRFLEHAHKFERLYDTDPLVYLLPENLKTAKQDKKPKMPFKEEHLAKIFDPQQEYFKSYPEPFLGLFSGAL